MKTREALKDIKKITFDIAFEAASKATQWEKKNSVTNWFGDISWREINTFQGKLNSFLFRIIETRPYSVTDHHPLCRTAYNRNKKSEYHGRLRGSEIKYSIGIYRSRRLISWIGYPLGYAQIYESQGFQKIECYGTPPEYERLARLFQKIKDQVKTAPTQKYVQKFLKQLG